MLDLNQFLKYKENNRLEVKQSLQGIPNSIWQTYSAFCNSYGGYILLGVAEDKNKNLYTCGLTEYQANNLLKSFWDTINNQTKVSINLLSDKNVQIQKINSDYIIIIDIPYIDKSFKPIYINNNPLFAYRRNHEGDYLCTKLEIQAMLRDQDEHSNDSQIIESMDLSVINKDTLMKYRTGYNQYHKEDHPFVKDDNENFLVHIGAAKRDNNGGIHPTKAGLLMFGNFYDITNVFPNYFLDYQDHRNLEGDDMRWSFRITSTNGDWSGNLYDFYYRIAFKLTEDIAVPFKMNGMFRDDSSPMKKAIREALCNTLSNADYHGELGLVIKQYHDKLVFSNPGILAMPLEKILICGESKARNRTILNIFSFVNIGERAGSGYPLILNATKEENYPSPELFDDFNPDVTKLTIFIKKETFGDENLGNKNGKPDIEVRKPDIEVQKPDIDLLINKINCQTNVKKHLLTIYNKLGTTIFGRGDVIKVTSSGKTQASIYIKILKDNSLITSVTGYGKGKYKFK